MVEFASRTRPCPRWPTTHRQCALADSKACSVSFAVTPARPSRPGNRGEQSDQTEGGRSPPLGVRSASRSAGRGRRGSRALARRACTRAESCPAPNPHPATVVPDAGPQSRRRSEPEVAPRSPLFERAALARPPWRRDVRRTSTRGTDCRRQRRPRRRLVYGGTQRVVFGRITGIDLIADPTSLGRLDLAVLDD